MKPILQLVLFVVFVVGSALTIAWFASATPYRPPNQPEVVRIDGCEYFITAGAYGHISYAHKGNCDNPIHRK